MLIVKDSPDFVIVDLKNWGFAKHYYDFFFFLKKKKQSLGQPDLLALKTRLKNLSTINFQVSFTRVISVVHRFIFILNEMIVECELLRITVLHLDFAIYMEMTLVTKWKCPDWSDYCKYYTDRQTYWPKEYFLL